ncbi:MAG TPA: FKBP-type peptidyl-prolyl cis-trans isomerase, partial [Ktedonobacteraceae bacterium]|nr:FKBP-type peptidyl-prolyl cis-trans isomerase [Ktedonobacteraceae bacterium]
MPQTVNGQNETKSTKYARPGQRQQERMQRLARRKKRQRIIASSISAFLIIAVGITGTLLFQNYRNQQIATANAHATGTALTGEHATATVISKNCFIATGAPVLPDIYAAKATPTAGPDTAPLASGTPVTTTDGLKYVDLKVGSGPAAKTGSTVTVNYSGWYASSCKKFDSSYDAHGDQKPQPYPVNVGKGEVIKGWDEG